MEALLPFPQDNKELSFPLPVGALPKPSLTIHEIQHYQSTARNIVDATVEAESEHRFNDAGLVDTDKWKLAAEDEGIRVYKRARRSLEDSDESTQPTVLCVGVMQSSIEEVLYGIHGSTTDETRAVSAVINRAYLDAAVVAVMERASPEDPFRQKSLKWRMSTTPGGNLIKNRDTFTLESAGISDDTRGERFGHFMMKSVERSDFPPFSPATSIRARLSLCYIFRKVGPTTISVFAKGTMDLGGDFPDWFSYNFACPRLPAILETTKAHIAKQVTALAIKKSRVFMPMTITRLGLSRMHSGSSDSSGPEADGVKKDLTRQNSMYCSVCQRKGAGLLRLRSSLQLCQICDRGVCSKCLMKHELLATPTNIQAMCCKACVVEAKALPIDHRMLCPILKQ